MDKPIRSRQAIKSLRFGLFLLKLRIGKSIFYADLISDREYISEAVNEHLLLCGENFVEVGIYGK